MAETIRGRLKHAWNAFVNKDSTDDHLGEYSPTYSYGSSRQDRIRPKFTVERTIISSIYTRMSIDAAGIGINHVRLDESDRYLEDIPSGMNNCFTVSANVDQTGAAFKRDAYQSLFDEGVIAIVPVDTTLNLLETGSFDILTMRIGRIVTWYPQAVKVSVYNEVKGTREDVTLPKTKVAIVENPFYAVMNEPNSTLQRLIHKLNLLDVVDEQTSSGKLDLIVQLPFVIKSEARRKQAEQRRKDIEDQLSGSKYGIAYTEATEHITQLNRPIENSLLAQVTYLTALLYSQLGLTDAILNGTADEKTMLNYYNRTIMPIVEAVVDSMKKTFLTPTARTQKQSIMAFNDPFKFMPVEGVAEIADKFARNEILTANEIRQMVGRKPMKDPKADMLLNSNMPQPGQPSQTSLSPPSPTPEIQDTSETQ